MPDSNDMRKQWEETSRPLPDPDAEESGFVLWDRPEPPPQPPHPGFWWAVLWCLGILLVTQLLPGIVGLFIFLFRASGRLTPAQMRDPEALVRTPEYAEAMLPALLLSQVLSVATAWLVIRLIVGKEWPRVLGLRRPSWSHLALALLGLPGLMVVAVGVDGLAKQVLPSFVDLEQTMGAFGKWPWALGVLVIGVGPGIGEELWFRGFFGSGLVGRHGVLVGVLLTSLLFGLIHLEPRQVVYAMVVGVLLHLSYLATRSLLVPVFLHVANNSLGILALHDPALRAIDMPAGEIPRYVYGTAILLVAAVGWAYFRTRTLVIAGSESGADPWRPAFDSVEYPPPASSARVVHRAPDVVTWLLALAAFAAFAAAVVPVVVAAGEKAREEKPRVVASMPAQAGFGVRRESPLWYFSSFTG